MDKSYIFLEIRNGDVWKSLSEANANETYIDIKMSTLRRIIDEHARPENQDMRILWFTDRFIACTKGCQCKQFFRSFEPASKAKKRRRIHQEALANII